VIDLLIAIRALHYAATIVAAGSALFCVLIAEPVWRPENPIGCSRGSVRLVLAAATVAAVSLPVWLIMLAAELADGHWQDALQGAAGWALLTGTRFGRVTQARLVAAALAAGLFLIPARTWLGWACCRCLGTVAACFLLVSLAWVGHAAAARGGTAWLHLAGDAIHLLAAGAWIGGLVPLLACMSSANRNEQLSMAAGVLRRFSRLAAASVAALLVSGVLSAYFLTDRLRALFSTDYGALIQVKVLLFLALLCLAAINRFLLVPHMSEQGGRPAATARQALGILRITIALEIAIGLAVLAVTAKLGMMAPAGHHH
jgi:putative copper resistance protein D